MTQAFTNKEGQTVPSVVWPTRQHHDWVNINSDDIFKGRTVVVFSLPGAFTPTCSSTHLPRFNELASVFFENGVDEIVCAIKAIGLRSSPMAIGC